MRSAALLLVLAMLGAASSPEELSRAKQTAYDIVALAQASESFATDHNKYPNAKTMEELHPLLSPTYIRNMPVIDAWGTPFRYFVSDDGEHYRFVSAGLDKRFDPTSLAVGKSLAKSDDIVFEDGTFLQGPESVL